MSKGRFGGAHKPRGWRATNLGPRGQAGRCHRAVRLRRPARRRRRSRPARWRPPRMPSLWRAAPPRAADPPTPAARPGPRSGCILTRGRHRRGGALRGSRPATVTVEEHVGRLSRCPPVTTTIRGPEPMDRARQRPRRRRRRPGRGQAASSSARASGRSASRPSRAAAAARSARRAPRARAAARRTPRPSPDRARPVSRAAARRAPARPPRSSATFPSIPILTASTPMSLADRPHLREDHLRRDRVHRSSRRPCSAP